MYKKSIIATLTLGICFMLGACSSTATQEQKKESNPFITQNEGEKDTLDQNDNKPVNDSFEGMELDGADLTMEQIIEQLKKDGIISGTPKDIKDGVANALRTTQIDGVLIVQFDTKDLSGFSKAYEANSIQFQNKDYKITAVNAQYMLILLDDKTDSAKAAASFQQSQNDGRVIYF